MPMAPPRPCTLPGCRHSRPCPTHDKAWHGDRPHWRERYGPAWDRTRAQVLAEEPFCRLCLKHGRRRPSTTVDHIVPKAWGGGDERTNLQALCAWHQHRKASREGAIGRNTRVAR